MGAVAAFERSTGSGGEGMYYVSEEIGRTVMK